MRGEEGEKEMAENIGGFDHQMAQQQLPFQEQSVTTIGQEEADIRVYIYVYLGFLHRLLLSTIHRYMPLATKIILEYIYHPEARH